ncbi:MAG: FIST C-terminal domain-containing protein [Bacteroidia bacterium]|nr:FIST C-terminal domain-containing protein [Bacteroidia bacterium]
MKVQQISLSLHTWKDDLSHISIEPDLFLLFISPEFKERQDVLDTLRQKFPEATITGCSTAGEISGINVKDRTVSLTAIKLEKVSHEQTHVKVDNMKFSYKAGRELGRALKKEDLRHVLVFSDGLNINGADLVSGLQSKLRDVSITGGLAADGPNFSSTFVITNDGIDSNCIVGIGFYGDALKVGYSSKGGWDSFGIERLVTKSHKNVLYELDGLPALTVYKSFLGEEAKNLPSSALLFPLCMRNNESDKPLVRTVLSVDEEKQSMTFAGNIHQGSYVRLMKANIDRLINGAGNSAKIAQEIIKESADLAILISCVGRRLVLKQLIEEEVEAVRDIIGDKPEITGFYSYGEIAPNGEFSPCELHNQTMTITTLTEC